MTTPNSNPFTTPTASVGEVATTFFKLGLTSFGGPVAHIGYFRKELVERRQWVSENQFAQLLAISQFLPGPASSQLGFSLGLVRGGWLGGLAAFTAFTLPSAMMLLLFAAALPILSGDVGQAVLHGLKLVAVAVVADAVLGMSRNLCPDRQRASIAVLAASAVLLVNEAWAHMAVVIVGAIAGIAFCSANAQSTSETIRVGYNRRVATALLIVFAVLLVGLPLLAGTNGLALIANIFYQAGALVFGGGHVVLPLLEEALVTPNLVSNETFLAGYGASQAIPGPMFAFSSYLGAVVPTGYHAAIGAIIALLFMFIPGFLLMAAALPLWSEIAHKPKLGKAIAGVNAAVVGLLGATLYDPIFTSSVSNVGDVAIALLAFAMLAVWKVSALYAVLWCVLASVLVSVLALAF